MKKVEGAASALGTDSFYEELEHMLHEGKIKVSPAAGAWMRAYQILPTEVKATGPKGFILKGDVLNHIEMKSLIKGKRMGPAQPAATTAAPAKSAAKSEKKPAAKK